MSLRLIDPDGEWMSRRCGGIVRGLHCSKVRGRLTLSVHHWLISGRPLAVRQADDDWLSSRMRWPRQRFSGSLG